MYPFVAQLTIVLILFAGMGGRIWSPYPINPPELDRSGIRSILAHPAAYETTPLRQRRKKRYSWKSCLPEGVKRIDPAADPLHAERSTTVENALNAANARCSNRKLIDKKGQEIRFVHLLCWGNPPADADEQTAAQTRDIAELKKRFTVIFLRCDPLTQ